VLRVGVPLLCVQGSGLIPSFSLDSSLQPELIQMLSNLLNDRSPLVLGCVCFAFEAICPTRLDLLHPHFRRFCRILVDVEEWGQIDVMNLLLRYSRTMLHRPDGEDMDKDVSLLLKSVEPLFQSRNPAVVLAATRVFYYVAPMSRYSAFVGSWLSLLNTSSGIERAVLTDVLVVSRKEPVCMYSFARSDATDLAINRVCFRLIFHDSLSDRPTLRL
jgi:AP-3 complex subunit beta